jgi:hypothetical protein
MPLDPELRGLLTPEEEAELAALESIRPAGSLLLTREQLMAMPRSLLDALCAWYEGLPENPTPAWEVEARNMPAPQLEDRRAEQ